MRRICLFLVSALASFALVCGYLRELSAEAQKTDTEPQELCEGEIWSCFIFNLNPNSTTYKFESMFYNSMAAINFTTSTNEIKYMEDPVTTLQFLNPLAPDPINVDITVIDENDNAVASGSCKIFSNVSVAFGVVISESSGAPEFLCISSISPTDAVIFTTDYALGIAEVVETITFDTTGKGNQVSYGSQPQEVKNPYGEEIRGPGTISYQDVAQEVPIAEISLNSDFFVRTGESAFFFYVGDGSPAYPYTIWGFGPAKTYHGVSPSTQTSTANYFESYNFICSTFFNVFPNDAEYSVEYSAYGNTYETPPISYLQSMVIPMLFTPEATSSTVTYTASSSSAGVSCSSQVIVYFSFASAFGVAASSPSETSQVGCFQVSNAKLTRSVVYQLFLATNFGEIAYQYFNGTAYDIPEFDQSSSYGSQSLIFGEPVFGDETFYTCFSSVTSETVKTSTDCKQITLNGLNIPVPQISLLLFVGNTFTEGRRLSNDTYDNTYYYLDTHEIAPTSQPTLQPATSQPTTGGGGGGGGGGDDCFLGSQLVILDNAEAVPISRVKVGDKVLSMRYDGTFEFSLVFHVPHPKNDIERSFVEIRTSSNRKLTATPEHLIRGGKCESLSDSRQFDLIAMKSLGRDSCVLTVDGIERVESVLTVVDKGIYTVVVDQGWIIVNGIVASPFAHSHYFPATFYNWAYFLFPSFFDGSQRTVDAVLKLGYIVSMMQVVFQNCHNVMESILMVSANTDVCAGY